MVGKYRLRKTGRDYYWIEEFDLAANKYVLRATASYLTLKEKVLKICDNAGLAELMLASTASIEEDESRAFVLEFNTETQRLEARVEEK